MPVGRTQLNYDDEVIITLSTLGLRTAITRDSDIDSTRLQGATLRKVKASMFFDGKTTGEGPITVGLAADLSAVEIKEALGGDPQRFKDPGKAEEANRRVFPIWVIPRNATASSPTPNPDSVYLRNIGVPSWKLIEGTTLRWFAFNANSSAALTDGTLVRISAVVVSRWEMD